MTPTEVSPAPLPALRRRLLVEGLLCGFTLLVVAVWSHTHSGHALLATLPAIIFGLPLFLLHWLLRGTASTASWIRILRRSSAPLLCALLAVVSWREAMRRGAPESQFRAVTGIPLPTGISISTPSSGSDRSAAAVWSISKGRLPSWNS